MAKEHHDEVDLVYVIKKIKEIIKGWIVLLFKAIDFALKFWFIILALILIGFGLGWYKVKDQKPSRKATVVAKLNYELFPYVENATLLYNSKAKKYDSLFLKPLGMNHWNPQVKEVMIEPIVDFKDITDDYQINERSLDMLLNRMEFDEETPLNDILAKKYDYFKFDISLSGYATPEDVQRFFDFLNNDPELAEYKKVAQQSMREQIEHNKKSLSLIDGVFESYLSTENGGTDIGPRDKGFDLNELMDAKLLVQDRNQILKDEIVLSQDIVVPLHEIRTRDADGRLLNKKHIIYPILFVFVFFLLAYTRYVYLYLRDVAKENQG
ncbi:hypothetical protein [Marinirhabdus gelatinilytica]|uniref:Subunit length determinant protein n=1 Tax=Marinirhabdus gelatinilytica TaxID=1703343 RepID=A0A370QJH9_9FLAO|nr:hypothetical protein [Marinirhabdus gelatinilytica]RDK88505.1 hypothetical protein C8D94_101379 [Marinirhabdus gelatinilytica]